MPVTRRRALLAGSTILGAAFLPSDQTYAAATPSRSVSHRASLPDLRNLVSVSDFEPLAEARWSEMTRALVRGGAADEITIRWNREAFDRLALHPRTLVDVSKVDTSLSLLGLALDHPVLLAPTAYHRMIHPGGEVETAKGAHRSNTLYVVSSASNTRIGKIREANPGPLWFQMYVQSDRSFVTEVIREVEEAGCRALVVTVDAPTVGARYRQMRAKFKLAPGLSLPYMDDINRGRDAVLKGGNARLTWKEIEWIQSVAKIPVLLKGILHPSDAERAVREKVSGIIVSNHGGRMLDTAPATMDVLPSITEVVAGRMPVLVDGGIRRGTDVVKALALGANAVLIGRPYLHGLGAAGAEGVMRVMVLLRGELEQAMALLGRPKLADLDRSVLWKPNRPS